jgi:hypothetical protein
MTNFKRLEPNVARATPAPGTGRARPIRHVNSTKTGGKRGGGEPVENEWITSGKPVENSSRLSPVVRLRQAPLTRSPRKMSFRWCGPLYRIFVFYGLAVARFFFRLIAFASFFCECALPEMKFERSRLFSHG